MATLSAAIKQIPSLTGKLKHGLQALRKNHRNAISPENSRKLSGSIDIDTALKSKYPNDHRWDYCIGVRKNRNADSLVWIEFHHSDQGDMAQAMACRPRQAIEGVDEDKNRPEMGADRAGGNPASSTEYSHRPVSAFRGGASIYSR